MVGSEQLNDDVDGDTGRSQDSCGLAGWGVAGQGKNPLRFE